MSSAFERGPLDICNKSHMYCGLLLKVISKGQGHIKKGKYVTCYIGHVEALSKAENNLEWNMGMVLTYARILFQWKMIRCAYRKDNSNPWECCWLSTRLQWMRASQYFRELLSILTFQRGEGMTSNVVYICPSTDWHLFRSCDASS